MLQLPLRTWTGGAGEHGVVRLADVGLSARPVSRSESAVTPRISARPSSTRLLTPVEASSPCSIWW